MGNVMLIDTDKIDKNTNVKHIWFSGGEPHIDLPELASTNVYVYAHLRKPEDVIKLTALLSAIHYRGGKAELILPYLPGARQDRVQDGYAFTAEMYAVILQGFVETIACVDPHSEAALETYNESVSTAALPFSTFIGDLIPDSPDIIIAPDKGAVFRAKEIGKALGCETIAFCTKERDPATGNLSGFSVPDLQSALKGQGGSTPHILIADDICDGGGTFIGICTEIRKQFPSAQIDLYVTHGIFSKGMVDLFEQIRIIYTTDSFYNGPSGAVNDHNGIYSIALEKYFLANRLDF